MNAVVELSLFEGSVVVTCEILAMTWRNSPLLEGCIVEGRTATPDGVTPERSAFKYSSASETYSL